MVKLEVIESEKLEAIVRRVDGSLWEIPLVQQQLIELYDLQEQGYMGKSLIDLWLTDDWGAPPIYVDVQGKDTEGNDVDIRLLYD